MTSFKFRSEKDVCADKEPQPPKQKQPDRGREWVVGAHPQRERARLGNRDVRERRRDAIVVQLREQRAEPLARPRGRGAQPV